MSLHEGAAAVPDELIAALAKARLGRSVANKVVQTLPSAPNQRTQSRLPSAPEHPSVPPSAAAKTASPRASKLKGLAANPDAPPAVQAVSLGLGVLREAGVKRWSDLGPELENWPADLSLSKDQLALLAEYSHLLGLIAFARPDTGEHTVSVAVCPVCGAFELTAGVWWRKCKLTRSCDGEPVKASVAKHAPPPSAP